METSGLWMLAAVAVAMLATGLPAWVVLTGVALAFCAAGIALGAFDLSLMGALDSRWVGLLENDLLQALPLYVLMGALINRLPLADILFRVASRALAPTGRAMPLAGLGLGVLLAPMCGSVGASVATLARTVYPRMAARGFPEDRNVALVCVASTLGVVVPPSLVLILLGDAMMRAHTEAANAVGLAGRIVNTQDVFHAALVPAAIVLVLTALIAGWRRSDGDAHAGADAPTRGEWITALASSLLIVSLLAYMAARFYRDHQVDVYSLHDVDRGILYVALGGIVLVLAAWGFGTTGGALLSIALLALCAGAQIRVYRNWQRY